MPAPACASCRKSWPPPVLLPLRRSFLREYAVVLFPEGSPRYSSVPQPAQHYGVMLGQLVGRGVGVDLLTHLVLYTERGGERERATTILLCDRIRLPSQNCVCVSVRPEEGLGVGLTCVCLVGGVDTTFILCPFWPLSCTGYRLSIFIQ